MYLDIMTYPKRVPREDVGGLSRQYVLRIPIVSWKATKWSGVSESPYKKGGPVSV